MRGSQPPGLDIGCDSVTVVTVILYRYWTDRGYRNPGQKRHTVTSCPFLRIHCSAAARRPPDADGETAGASDPPYALLSTVRRRGRRPPDVPAESPLASHFSSANSHGFHTSYYNKFGWKPGKPAGLFSISCLSYNKRSNWLADTSLGFHVRHKDCQPSSCCSVRFKQVEPSCSRHPID